MRKLVAAAVLLAVVGSFSYANHEMVDIYQPPTPQINHAIVPKESPVWANSHWDDRIHQNQAGVPQLANQGISWVGPNVDTVEVSGDMDVILSTNLSGNSFRYTSQKNVDPLWVKRMGNRLLLCHGEYCLRHTQCVDCCGKPGWNERPRVFINVANLRNLKFVGAGHVQGSGIRSSGLSLNVINCGPTQLQGSQLALTKVTTGGSGEVTLRAPVSPQLSVKVGGNSIVTLRGMSDLRRLYFSGAGRLNMYWLNTCRLKIFGEGHAEAFLSGIADRVDAVLKDEAFLDARFLRAKHEVVHTFNGSRADVWSNWTLDAFAENQSNIYYYHEPRFLGNYMLDNGAVLSMENVEDFSCQGRGPLYDERCKLPPLV